MTDNTVTIDTSTSPATLEFSAKYNTAIPMIDRHLAEGRGAKVAIRTVGGEVSYGELADQVNQCGNALLAQGAKQGDRILMMIKDCPEFIYVFYGAIKAGVVPVPVNTLLRSADYQYMIEDSGCAGLIYSPEYAAEVEPALPDAARKPDFTLRTEGVGGLGDLMAASSNALDPAPATIDDECFWLYSSGSTGRPKGTVHRQRDIVETAVHYGVGVVGHDEDDVTFSAAKLFFAYGLGNSMNFPLWSGGCVILSDRVPSPDMTFEMIEQFKPTIFYGVPTLYAAQLRALESQDRDLSSLRICLSAGETLPADLYRRWTERTGLLVLDGIGSTEGLHIFISNTPENHRPGSSGLIVPGYEAKVVDEAGAEIPPGETGRLMVKGGSMAAYYWHQPERTAATMKGDWVDTGDTYIRDEEGWFTYCGRSDDMIKVGGIWCSPAEVEAKLIEHPKVLEAAVVGQEDDDGLTKPAAFIILNNPDESIDGLADELLEHCKDGLARYKYPRWFNFVDELPKTATGKIQRFRLRQE
ncbi:MAG: benzoate-CoA ligase family protein [Rhodospirillales bacterium]|nr:benzoate-CoA ligase family protein [Rhodospirillales bacterium]